MKNRMVWGLSMFGVFRLLLNEVVHKGGDWSLKGFA
jgi:hypothetical protein